MERAERVKQRTDIKKCVSEIVFDTNHCARASVGGVSLYVVVTRRVGIDFIEEVHGCCRVERMQWSYSSRR